MARAAKKTRKKASRKGGAKARASRKVTKKKTASKPAAKKKATKRSAAKKKVGKKTTKSATKRRRPAADANGTKAKTGIYDESAIQTLDALEHIRLRTGMYIGRIGDGSHPLDGVYVMLKEVIDNAVDEFIMGAGKEIVITRDGNEITVRDFGRGIPLGKVVDCVSQINTGGKYNDEVFQFSVGLNGVGTKAVNALSESFEVESYRGGKAKQASFRCGQLLKESTRRKTREPDGTFVRFTPDPQIFESIHWDEDHILQRLSYYAFLNAGLKLIYNGKTVVSRRGLYDLLEPEIGDGQKLYDTVHFKLDRLEFAFTHTNSYGETYFSFVNGQYTNDGGTHQSAFREGLLKGINEFANATFAGEDVREGLVGAVAIKLQDPVFESQTKNKLGSTEVRPWIVGEVRQQVVLWLHQNKEQAEALVTKIRTNERLRRELASIKKQARERAKSVAIRIPKLIDCKQHLDAPKDKRRVESTIFLTEGDSAGGALVQSRDVQTQAIFCLKGKPPNTYGQRREVVYKNEELYNIMRALGIEEGIDRLRYNRVVIATDADVDGMHIRNLLLTYFYRFFEELVTLGHIYILETPLFRVRNKQRTRYCYSDKERAAAMAEIKGAEITRFKGLGEISPHEFTQFIGEGIRLVPVVSSSPREARRCLDFVMGKNTPARREFIVQNLIAEVA